MLKKKRLFLRNLSPAKENLDFKKKTLRASKNCVQPIFQYNVLLYKITSKSNFSELLRS